MVLIANSLSNSNNLLKNGTSCLTDFGLSRDLKEDKDERLRLRLYGRLGYIDPELLKKPRPESAPRHDIFGLAVLYWEIMSTENPNSSLHSSRTNPKRLGQVKGCPDAFYQLYTNCSREMKLPDDRPSAAKVVDILEQMLASMTSEEVARPEKSNTMNEGANLDDEGIVSELVTTRRMDDSGYQTGSIITKNLSVHAGSISEGAVPTIAKSLKWNTLQNEQLLEDYWNDALEIRLCKLYAQDDVVDIFWGRHFGAKDLTWNVYVIMRGAYRPLSQTEILNGQIIYIIAEEFFVLDRNLSSKIPRPLMSIPQQLRDAFDEALDEELAMEIRKKHYNLIAISTGYKIIRGELTTIPAIILYVKQKGIEHRGSPGLFPTEIRGFATDVVEAIPATPCVNFGKAECQSHQSDITLGCSIGLGANEYTSDTFENWKKFNQFTTCGTLGAFARDTHLNNELGILSCQHVLQFAEANPSEDLSIYQPADNDSLTKLVKEFRDLKNRRNRNESEEELLKIKICGALTKNVNTKLANYVRGVRKNVKVANREYGVDAAFGILELDPSRTVLPNTFSVSKQDFASTDLPTVHLTGVHDYDSLQQFDRGNKVFKVGRTTGLSCGFWEIEASITTSLTNASTREAMRRHNTKTSRPNNTDQPFIGYMKTYFNETICERRQECFPVVWFDRQMAVRFQNEDVDAGDSGASVVDEKGQALGMLHSKWRTPYSKYAIVSPYFAICKALHVKIQHF
ncbi:hypothetical protein BC937DRAFT_90797 [Endogone sp. FLAS-F59071]|nr:hypothetical protein BC937DRAFT_90797 [Endogone sp. FLAS-F59071]|eukprot:RUS16801.1 hypothetical protein BC937DRAFT_90797 [Endogone sp. FLAS-F59071]